MLSEMKQGMTVKCLNCGKPIKLTNDTFKRSWDCVFVYCPSCGRAFDVQAYHAKGEMLND